MGVSRQHILEALGIQRSKRMVVLIPIKFIKKIELIYLFLYKTGIGFHLLVDIMLAVGANVIYELVSTHKVTSLWHVLRILNCIQNTTREYVVVSNEMYPFINIVTLKYIFREMLRMKFTEEQKFQFFNYLLENEKEILGEKIVLDDLDIHRVMVAWIENMASLRSNKG
jgi:hypothetical protein